MASLGRLLAMHRGYGRFQPPVRHHRSGNLLLHAGWYACDPGPLCRYRVPPKETAANSVEPKLPTIKLSTIPIKV